MDRHLIWKGEILWEKNNYNCKYTAWGSWKSPSNPYLKYTWEFLEVFAKGDLKKRAPPTGLTSRPTSSRSGWSHAGRSVPRGG